MNVIRGAQDHYFKHYGHLKIHDFSKYDDFTTYSIKYAHLVYKIIKCVLNRDQFLLMFLNMTHAYNKFPKHLFGFL